MMIGKSLLMLSGLIAFLTIAMVLVAIFTGNDLAYAIIRHNYVWGLLGSGASAFIGGVLFVRNV